MKTDKLRQRSALQVGISTAFITGFSGSALNLAIPDMGSYFHMGAVSVGWLVTVYMLTVAALSVPFGKIADTTSRRKVLMIGTAVFGLSSLASVFANSAAVILMLRALQALGSAMIFATNMPLVINAFPLAERGRAIGLVTAGTYTSLAAGPVLGGLLNHYCGWQSIFVLSAAVSLFAFGIAAGRLDRQEQHFAGGRMDIKGNVLYVLMISLLIYGLTVITSQRFGWLLLVLGLLAGLLFVYVELHAENPVINVRIFASNALYTLSNVSALFNYSATFALGYLGSIYLQVVQGFSSQTAGLILITQPLLMALLSPRTGKLSDRIPAYKLASAGMILCAVSLAFFATVGAWTPVWLIVLALAVAGAGIALFSSPNTNIIMSCVEPKDFGIATSVLTTMRTTGQSTGIAIITLIVGLMVGNVSLYEVDPVSLVNTMHIAFTVFTLLCVTGVFMSLKRR